MGEAILKRLWYGGVIFLVRWSVITNNASNMMRAFLMIIAGSTKDKEESDIDDEDEELVLLELGMIPAHHPLFVTHYTAGGQRWVKSS